MMKLKIVLEPSDEGGFTVIVPSLPGCISEGRTRQEALINIKEAVLLYLEPVADDLNYPPDSEIVEISLWQKFPASIIERSSEHLEEMDGLLCANEAAT